jgi:hypothetical protein
MFARVNLELARTISAVGGAYMIDELDARERSSPGIYWDDRYNCAAHRAPLSSWNWVVLKPGRTDEPPPRDADRLTPPARADQSDPAGAMALAVLELMVRLVRPRRMDTIVFEPRGLLWPARRGPNDLERAAQRNFLVDVEDYWFAGVAEALNAVARRGIRLICLTDENLADLKRGVAATPGTDTLLCREALAEIHSTPRKHEFVEDLLKRDREPGACALWIDFTLADARARDGLVVLPETARWQLRELLLRAPELAPPLAGPGVSDDRAMAPAAEWLHDEAGLRGRVREAIRLALAAEAKCSPEDLESVVDLADIGLDSLSVARVLMSIEERLETRIDSWERIGAALYEVRTLEEVFLAALRSGAAGGSSRQD